MLNTAKYTHVSENVQLKLDNFAQEYEDKGRDLKSKLDHLLSKLVESELLPGDVPEYTMSDVAALQRHSDFQTRLDRLESKINDFEVNGGRPRSQLLDAESQLSLGVKRPREPTSDGQRETLKELANRLEQLEARTAEIDNQATQQAENVIEIVDARIEEKLEGLLLKDCTSGDVEMADSSSTVSQPQPGPVSRDDPQDQVVKLTTDLDVFAEETYTLITKQGRMEADMKQLQMENEALKILVTSVRIIVQLIRYVTLIIQQRESSQRSLQAVVDRNTRQLETLLAAVKIMRESCPTPPVVTALDHQAFDPMMQKRIVEDVLRDVTPALHALREHCETAITTAREETLSQVVAKLGRTAELVDVLYGYFRV